MATAVFLENETFAVVSAATIASKMTIAVVN